MWLQKSDLNTIKVIFPDVGRSEAVVRRCSVKNVALKNFAEFIAKQLCQSLFFNKVAVVNFILKTSLKKRLLRRRFPVNFKQFLRTSFFTEHLRWLLLSDVPSAYITLNSLKVP